MLTLLLTSALAHHSDCPDAALQVRQAGQDSYTTLCLNPEQAVDTTYAGPQSEQWRVRATPRQHGGELFYDIHYTLVSMGDQAAQDAISDGYRPALKRFEETHRVQMRPSTDQLAEDYTEVPVAVVDAGMVYLPVGLSFTLDPH